VRFTKSVKTVTEPFVGFEVSNNQRGLMIFTIRHREVDIHNCKRRIITK